MNRALAGLLAVSLLVNGALAGLIAGHLLTDQGRCRCEERKPRRYPTGWVPPDDSDRLPHKPTGEVR